MMTKAGHDKARSGGLIAAAGIIGPVIPPSIGFVIFGVVGGVSITKLFLAGIVPGILIAISLCCAWWWQVRNEDIASPPRQTWRESGRAVVDGSWALGLPFIIVFGLKFGLFTPTEAAGVAVLGYIGLRTLRRSRSELLESHALERRFESLLDQTLDDLYAQKDPRKAIIAAVLIPAAPNATVSSTRDRHPDEGSPAARSPRHPS